MGGAIGGDARVTGCAPVEELNKFPGEGVEIDQESLIALQFVEVFLANVEGEEKVRIGFVRNFHVKQTFAHQVRACSGTVSYAAVTLPATPSAPFSEQDPDCKPLHGLRAHFVAARDCIVCSLSRRREMGEPFRLARHNFGLSKCSFTLFPLLSLSLSLSLSLARARALLVNRPPHTIFLYARALLENTSTTSRLRFSLPLRELERTRTGSSASKRGRSLSNSTMVHTLNPPQQSPPSSRHLCSSRSKF